MRFTLLLTFSVVLCAAALTAVPAFAARTAPGGSAADASQSRLNRSTASTSRSLRSPTATVSVRVAGGRPVGGIARPKLKKGQSVVLVVRSDIADEVHLHGYDISRRVRAGGVVRIAFLAKIPGRFEVELEKSGIQLAELTVS